MKENWQQCNHTTYFPTYSYEQYYQAIRRFWRFGQKYPVTVDLTSVVSDTYLIKQKLDSLITKTSQMYTTMNGGVTSAAMQTEITSIAIPNQVYTGTRGVTFGATTTLSSTYLKTGITVKNKSDLDINIQGNGTTSSTYAISSGEILFIETDNLNNISFTVSSGAATFTYIAT